LPAEEAELQFDQEDDALTVVSTAPEPEVIALLLAGVAVLDGCRRITARLRRI